MLHHLLWIALLLALHLAVIGMVLVNGDINDGARTSWLLLIVFLPTVGLALYLFFGEPWVARQVRRRAGRRQARDETEPAPALPPLLPDRYGPAFALGCAVAGCAVAEGNHASLMADSDAAIDAMAADIDAARHTVHISFYIWLTDGNGTKMVDAVSRAARRGVVCRVMVDALGSRDLVRSPQWQAMAAAGVRLAVALRASFGTPWRSRSRPDLRNHRKIVVIDDAVTYCGSQNCADPAFLVKARFGPWVDIMLRLTGPVVAQNQMLFSDSWSIEAGEDLGSGGPEGLKPPAPGGFPAIAFGTGPLSPKGSMSDVFVALLGSAAREVVISTPYFVPDPPLLSALLACARRGVATTLILPARNDSAAVAGLSRARYAALLAAGVELHEYGGGLLHAKTLVVDRCVSLVGSSNMDYRSLHLNFENNVLLFSPEVSATIRERQSSYLACSTPVSVAKVRACSKLRVAFDNLLCVVSPVY